MSKRMPKLTKDCKKLDIENHADILLDCHTEVLSNNSNGKFLCLADTNKFHFTYGLFYDCSDIECEDCYWDPANVSKLSKISKIRKLKLIESSK